MQTTGSSLQARGCGWHLKTCLFMCTPRSWLPGLWVHFPSQKSLTLFLCIHPGHQRSTPRFMSARLSQSKKMLWCLPPPDHWRWHGVHIQDTTGSGPWKTVLGTFMPATQRLLGHQKSAIEWGGGGYCCVSSSVNFSQIHVQCLMF